MLCDSFPTSQSNRASHDTYNHLRIASALCESKILALTTLKSVLISTFIVLRKL